jgi:hypothetical protein
MLLEAPRCGELLSIWPRIVLLRRKDASGVVHFTLLQLGQSKFEYWNAVYLESSRVRDSESEYVTYSILFYDRNI